MEDQQGDAASSELHNSATALTHAAMTVNNLALQQHGFDNGLASRGGQHQHQHQLQFTLPMPSGQPVLYGGLSHPQAVGNISIGVNGLSQVQLTGDPALGMGATADGLLPAGGKQVCTFFMRTGTCAYGDRCKFIHPANCPPPQLNSRGYPLRPEEPDCAHYLKKGWCAFGITCKFNHPELATTTLLTHYTLPGALTAGNPAFSVNIAAASPAAAQAAAYAPAASLTYAPALSPGPMPTAVYYVPTVGGSGMLAAAQPQQQLASLMTTSPAYTTAGGSMALAAASAAAGAGAAGPSAALLGMAGGGQQGMYALRQQAGGAAAMMTFPNAAGAAGMGLAGLGGATVGDVSQSLHRMPADQLARAMQGLRLGRDGGGYHK